MNLPPSIQAYFDANETTDGEALLRAFAPDAVVGDEGRSHTGHQAIAAWWHDVQAKYRPVAKPLEKDEQGDVTKVRAEVTGRFPGSPVTLTFAFRLDGDRIASLDIGA